MEIASRDSDTLKPPELDELGQLLATSSPGIPDAEIDHQVEQFPLVVTAKSHEEVEAFLFGSLERIGGTPCVLWGLGTTRPGRNARKVLAEMTEELLRRAAITFPDEDVLVGGRFAQPAGYSLLDGLSDRCPRSGHKATGEERAWGRRLAKRFGCDDRYDDRSFTVAAAATPEPTVDAVALNSSSRSAVPLFEVLDAGRGDALIAFGWAMAEALATRWA